MLEGEEKEQEIGNLFEKIMKENFPNLKEIDVQIQDAHRVPNKMDFDIEMRKIKDKERILKAVRETQR